MSEQSMSLSATFPQVLQPNTISQAGHFYRDHLLDQIIPFWEKHSIDHAYGGFLHSLDRVGGVIDPIKNTWCQGRQTWMFAALYRDLEARSSWKHFAQLGRDYLVNRAWDGQGHFYYQTDQRGIATIETRSWFSDAFALLGLCGWHQIASQPSDGDIIDQVFTQLIQSLQTPGFNQYHHFDLDPTRQWHAPWMVILSMAPDLEAVLGIDRVKTIVDKARHKVLHVFARNQEQMLFECLDSQGQPINDRLGLTVNPGHALESLWFAMEEAQRRDDKDDHARAVEVAGWVFDKGWDSQCGGLLAFTSPDGSPPLGHEQPANAWGEKWDDKVWWVHAEALYTVARSAVTTGDPRWYERWQMLHKATFTRFPDPVHGEWYEYFDRCAKTPRTYDKGRWIKCAFHIPRALLKLACFLEKK